METEPRSNPKGTSAAAGAGALPPDPRMARLERHVLEAFDELWDHFVDPADALYDAEGTRWAEVGGALAPGTSGAAAFTNE